MRSYRPVLLADTPVQWNAIDRFINFKHIWSIRCKNGESSSSHFTFKVPHQASFCHFVSRPLHSRPIFCSYSFWNGLSLVESRFRVCSIRGRIFGTVPARRESRKKVASLQSPPPAAPARPPPRLPPTLSPPSRNGFADVADILFYCAIAPFNRNNACIWLNVLEMFHFSSQPKLKCLPSEK